jgi:hypothetical protein
MSCENIVCDVGNIEYYGIFVVSDARLYEFKRVLKLETQNPYFGLVNYCQLLHDPKFKFYDDLATTIQAIIDNLVALNSSLQTEGKFSRTFNMSFLTHKKHISMFDVEFVSASHSMVYPFFTSQDKAKEFLVDITRIIHGSDVYVEFDRSGHIIKRQPAELSIVRYSLTELENLSELYTIVINPYVPVFF